jgi:hypothetical protein
MEESELYAKATRDIIPPRLLPFIELIVSEVSESAYDDTWVGFSYLQTPMRGYDFIFVDGPQLPSGKTAHKYFDSDVSLHLERSSKSFSGFVDGRKSTVERLSSDSRLKISRGKFLTKFSYEQG